MTNIVCQCCKQARNRIEGRKSRLVPMMNVLVCQHCERAGHEPRHIVVLAAKSKVDVASYIKGRHYCGKSLEAIEVTP